MVPPGDLALESGYKVNFSETFGPNKILAVAYLDFEETTVLIPHQNPAKSCA